LVFANGGVRLAMDETSLWSHPSGSIGNAGQSRLDGGFDMSHRLARFVPLVIGVLFVVFAVTGSMQSGNTPDTTANGATTLAYYQAHNSRMGSASFSMMLSVVFGLFFYGMVRTYLSRSPRAEWLAFVGFGGAVVFGVGAVVEAGVDFAFSDVQRNLSAASATTLNILQSDLSVMLYTAGLCVLMVGFGMAMLRSRLMPRWLGWASIVIGLMAAAGPLIGVAIPLEALWVLVVSFMLFQRNALVPPTPTTDQPRTPTATT